MKSRNSIPEKRNDKKKKQTPISNRENNSHDDGDNEESVICSKYLFRAKFIHTRIHILFFLFVCLHLGGIDYIKWDSLERDISPHFSSSPFDI